MRLDGERVTGVAAMLVGLLAVVESFRLAEDTLTGGPGPRFLPASLGLIVAVLGGAIAVRPPPGGPGCRCRPASWGREPRVIDVLQNLGMGFAVALAPANLLYCFVGVLVGTIIGVLPGIGPGTAVAILLPLTFGMNPASALIMLAGIYYGSQYGGSTTAILINTPGESASVMTCLDGYQMARKGRAGPALGMAALGAFIAGTAGVVLLMFLARPLVTLALSFGPAEYFALMLLALCTLGGLVGESVAKGLVMGGFGLLLGASGSDPLTRGARLPFGIPSLLDGLEFLPVAIGLFAVAEVLTTAERSVAPQVYETRITGLLPTREAWWACRFTLPRASLLGFVVGVLPGAGSTLASFGTAEVVGTVRRQISGNGPFSFGSPLAPEAANN